jgi:tight adherence protein C
MELLLALLLGTSILFVFAGLGLSARPSQVQARLQAYGTRPRTLSEIELEMPFSERILLPALRGMSKFVARFTPEHTIEEVRHKLDLAGNPNNWTAGDFLGVRGLGAVVLGLLTLVTLFFARTAFAQLLLFTGIGAFFGFYLPMFWLNFKIRARQHDIQMELPDALDLLTISVEAGLGFDAAVAKVVEKWNNELGRAFARVNQEIRVGKLRRQALRDMAERAEVQDLSTFIAAIVQADQLGVSISKVLRIQSEQMRVKRRQRAEAEAARAPVKMLIPLVFLVFPSLFIVLMGPAALIIMKSGIF